MAIVGVKGLTCLLTISPVRLCFTCHQGVFHLIVNVFLPARQRVVSKGKLAMNIFASFVLK